MKRALKYMNPVSENLHCTTNKKKYKVAYLRKLMKQVKTKTAT